MAFTEIDEKLLVRAYQAGDERAFDTIVRTQYNALYAHALRRLSQHEAAEDAVQDTLLRAYRALGNLDGDLALKAWLHRILTNVCYDEGNRRRRQQGLVEKVAALPEELAADPVDDAVLHDTVRVMSEALKDLPESYREALVLRYVDGLSFREVAEATGVSEENARARVHRGRLALHKVLSRLAVLAAFIIPGLKRTHAATPAVTTADQAAATTGLSDHAVTLTTQLTSHVMTAAPTMSRFAEAASSIPSGAKSALAAAAVTAVAAVSVPVAVHTVQEVNKPSKPPVASAPPTTDQLKRLESTLEAAGASGNMGTTPAADASTSTTASTTIPESQANPFGLNGGVQASTDTSTTSSTDPSTTTTTTVTTTPAPVNQGPVLEGRIGGDSITATGTAPNWDVQGPISLTVNGKTHSGTISGRVYVYAEDGKAESSELTLTIAGKTLFLRFTGQITDTQSGAGTTTYKVSGFYRLVGAADFGLADKGDVVTVLKLGSGASSLVFDLRGQKSSS